MAHGAQLFAGIAIQLSECALTGKRWGSTGSGRGKVGKVCPLPIRGGVWKRLGKFLEFSSIKCRVLCIFIAKNYLWPEPRNRDRGGLIDPLGSEDVKRTGVKHLAGNSTPQSTVNSCPASCYLPSSLCR